MCEHVCACGHWGVGGLKVDPMLTSFESVLHYNNESILLPFGDITRGGVLLGETDGASFVTMPSARSKKMD